MGNIERESVFNPGAWYTLGIPESAYGLVQWNPGLDFFKWMDDSKGYDMKSDNYMSGVSVVNNMAKNEPKTLMNLQLEFLLRSSETNAPYEYHRWLPTADYGSSYKMKYEDYIVSESDVQELAYIFYISYERAGDPTEVVQERKDNAVKWYEILKDIE